jgi:hypothetical protein
MTFFPTFLLLASKILSRSPVKENQFLVDSDSGTNPAD